jgi:putative acetyltransferase
MPSPIEPIEIRRYKPGEEPAIWNVYFLATHLSIARDYHPDLIQRWAPRTQDMKQWAERLARKNPFVAVVDGHVIGMAEIEADGFIDYFYVHPHWQRRGIGKALLERIETEARTHGIRTIFADVSVTAKDFFAARGFDVLESKNKVILGHLAPNFRMEKLLGG